MIERVKSTRRGKMGGRRPGAGRKKGSRPEYKRVLAARAAREGALPHELMLEWARTGVMVDTKGTRVELAPADRISCAKGAAPHYHAPMQAVKHTGDVEQPLVITLDDQVLAALAKRHPDRLEILRDVLRALQAGEVDKLVGERRPTADPSAYAATLAPGTRTAGSA